MISSTTDFFTQHSFSLSSAVHNNKKIPRKDNGSIYLNNHRNVQYFLCVYKRQMGDVVIANPRMMLQLQSKETIYWLKNTITSPPIKSHIHYTVIAVIAVIALRINMS